MDRNNQCNNEKKIAPSSGEATILVNETGIITSVNQRACDNFGYQENELIGKDVNELIPETDLFYTEEGMVIHHSGRHKDGFPLSMFFRVNSFTLKDEVFFLLVLNSVKDRSRLNKQQSYPLNELVDLKFALDASSIVAITDRRGVITYVNEEFCRISKYSREELIGKDHRIINSGYHPKKFFTELWRTILSGHVWKGEIKNRAKDGSNYWVDTTIVPYLDDTGNPYQFLAIRHEVTKLKQVEEELQVMMSKIIAVQEEERRRLSRELHDGIGQNLYSHLITINRLQAEENHPLLDQMQDEATEIIEDVRGISWELRPSVLDDLGLIPAIRSYLVRFSEYYHIDVHFDSYMNCRLSANKEISIYRIIQESLTNIRKYAETEEATVTIREFDDVLRVMIEDKGKGFNPKTINRGVGLFSMEERARAAGGSLTISSEKGQGTKIILEVPLGDAQP